MKSLRCGVNSHDLSYTYMNGNMQGPRTLLITGQVLLFKLLRLFVSRLRSRRCTIAIQRTRMRHRVSVIMIDGVVWSTDCISASILQVATVWEVNWIWILHIRVHHWCWWLDWWCWGWWSCRCIIDISSDGIWLVGLIFQWQIWNGSDVATVTRMWLQWWW